MLSNANSTNSFEQDNSDKIISLLPNKSEEDNKSLNLTVEKAIVEPSAINEHEELKVTEEKVEGDKPRDNEHNLEANETNTTKTVQETRVDRYLNRQTKNTNILCLGIADQELEMISIYSINKENKKSGGIFLPTRTSLKVNGEFLTLKGIYQKYGILNLKKILSRCLEVNIPYHMVADKKGLVELSELIGPLYVENENIDIPNLFVRPVSGKDDEILQSLAKKITQPMMVLQVPKLIKIFITNVQSDIGVSGLWDLYSVFKNLNHSELSKIVLWGEKATLADNDYWFITPYDWHNVVYEMTE